MKKQASRKVTPVVFVFPLSDVGEWLSKKVPAKYAPAAGYWYRTAHEAHTHAMRAIEEPEMSEKEADKLLGWVEEYVDACDLRPSIYTDDEHAEMDAFDDDNFGFHPGLSVDEASRALEAGGFRVLRAPFPQTLAFEPNKSDRFARQLEAVVARIEHHLAFASIARALGSLELSEQVSSNLRQVMNLLDNFMGSEPDDTLVAHLLVAQTKWPVSHRDKLHLVLAEIKKWKERRSQPLNPNVTRLRAALPPAEDAGVAKSLSGAMAAKVKAVKPAARAQKVSPKRPAAKATKAASATKSPRSKAAKSAR